MKTGGSRQRRALLVNGELDVRKTISRYLQLHGMHVIETDSLHEAYGQLEAAGSFDLMVTELKTPDHAEWNEWRSLVTKDADMPVLIHGRRMYEWEEVQGKLGRKVNFIGNAFTFSDFHWALKQIF